MLRILRAFAWMRWRVLINAIERTGARDTVERLSLAVEQIGPLVALALFVPSAIALAGLAGYAGFALASSGDTPLTIDVLRYLMLASVGITIVGPILLPGGERTNAVRLLLLPIPRAVLYVAQAASALADPWILLAVPIVLALPVGLAVGGAFVTAFVALLAGALFVAGLLGISSLTTSVMHLLVRDRRRGELLAVLFMVVLPTLAIIPSTFHDDDARPRAERRSSGPSESMNSWLRHAGATALRLAPSELYRASVLDADAGRLSATTPLMGLLAVGGVLHGLGLIAFGRLLDSPGSTGTRRSAGNLSRRAVTLPGISPGASAVAISQIRLALRTPRGRSTLLSPLAVFVMFGILMRRSGGQMEFGFIDLDGGLALAAFASAVCLLSILPFAMNQFAIDRAGLTLQLLSPLRELDILIGKAVGNGLITGIPTIVCVTVAYALFPGGTPALWLAVPLGAFAAYILATPAAAALSALFPRAVDLNSIGRGSNAHGAAGLLGMATFVAGAAPPVLLTLLATSALGRPHLAPVFLLIWCAIAVLIARLLLLPVAALFNRRRENLALVV